MKKGEKQRITFLLKKHFTAWLVSALLTFIFFSLTPWLLAYYGYINLRLPSRFDYQKLNKEISNNLPSEYSYSLLDPDSFRFTGSDSIIVYANSEDYFKWEISNNDLNTIRTGIILILDKVDNNYKVSYKYQLITGDRKQDNWGFRLFKPELIDFDADGKKEIYTQWHPIGADLGPGFFIIFDDKDGKIMTYSSESERITNKETIYSEIQIKNQFNNNETLKTGLAEYFDYSDSLILANYVLDNECRACDHAYKSNLYGFDHIDGAFKKIDTLWFNSNEDLENFRKENNFINTFVRDD